MKLKVEYGKKAVFNNLKQFSNNVMINNFIFELINHGSITNFFCENGQYVFENKKGEKIFIVINSNIVFVRSYIDGINQVFKCEKNNDLKVILNVSTDIEWPSYSEKRHVSLEVLYDCYDNLVSYEIINNNLLNSSFDDEIDSNLKNNDYENYTITTRVDTVGDKLVSVETTDYLYNYSKNRISYYVCDYDEDFFDEVCSFVKPKFKEITEDEYNFLKNGAQKVKTMV